LIEVKPFMTQADIPVFVSDLSPLTSHLDLARQAINELRISHPQSPESNVKATYMSPWQSHLLNDKLVPLAQVVLDVGKQASKLLSANLDSLNLELVVSDCWGIIYEEASHTLPHNHFPSDFSCSIYLEAHSDSAPIIFAGKYPLQPQPNMLVMFPGILTHEVPATKGRRVVVAMNLHKQATFASVKT
jgi:hypothetical protein